MICWKSAKLSTEELWILLLPDCSSFSPSFTTLLERSHKFNRKKFFVFSSFCLITNGFFRFIISSQRTAALRQDNDTQATLINIILKNYISLNLIDQADKLVSKSVFPETVGNNQLARYMYYLGKQSIR